MYVTKSDRETNSGTFAERRGCLPTAAAESTEVSPRVWQLLCIRHTQGAELKGQADDSRDTFSSSE